MHMFEKKQTHKGFLLCFDSGGEWSLSALRPPDKEPSTGANLAGLQKVTPLCTLWDIWAIQGDHLQVLLVILF